MEAAMSDAVLNSRAMERVAATTAPLVRAGWASLTSLPARWLSRQRRSGSIAHLDDRLLADAGFTRRDLGLGERLIRHFVAGGDIWRREGIGR
jgi:uncharacterized protein YjiS (DUF1127 family)